MLNRIRNKLNPAQEMDEEVEVDNIYAIHSRARNHYRRGN